MYVTSIENKSRLKLVKKVLSANLTIFYCLLPEHANISNANSICKRFAQMYVQTYFARDTSIFLLMGAQLRAPLKPLIRQFCYVRRISKGTQLVIHDAETRKSFGQLYAVVFPVQRLSPLCLSQENDSTIFCIQFRIVTAMNNIMIFICLYIIYTFTFILFSEVFQNLIIMFSLFFVIVYIYLYLFMLRL